MRAIDSGNAQIITKLVRDAANGTEGLHHAKELLEERNSSGDTPLLHAARMGNMKAWDTLVSLCPESFKSKMIAERNSISGENAFMLAVKEGITAAYRSLPPANKAFETRA